MRILTVSASPFLLTRLGRMNASVLRHLKSEGNEVATVCWHHDLSYFMPDGDGKHWFTDSDDLAFARLYPVPSGEAGIGKTYDMIKEFNPDVVLSIGDYDEVAWLSAIKAMYPKLFRWAAILTIDTPGIDQRYLDHLSHVDATAATTDMGVTELRSVGVKASLIRPGVDGSVFYPAEKACDKIAVISCSKNSHPSNLGALAIAMNRVQSYRTGVGCYLHTNVNDPGDYDLKAMIDKFKAPITLPSKFVSVSVGLTDDEMRGMYQSSLFVVDASVRSATAMSVLEGMACGCVPIVSGAGALGEITNQIHSSVPLSCILTPFIGDRLEEMSIVEPMDIAASILTLSDLYYNNRDYFLAIREKSMEIAKRVSLERFVLQVSDLVEAASVVPQPRIPVELFS